MLFSSYILGFYEERKLPDNVFRIPMWMRNMSCNGDESQLSECDTGQWGGHGGHCTRSHSAGVVCHNTTVNFTHPAGTYIYL